MDVWFYIEKGTTAERHERELTNLKDFFSRAPPKRVRRAFALLTRTYHGCRQPLPYRIMEGLPVNRQESGPVCGFER